MAKPEIMSPAGHWPQLRAAIEAGADAVYFGLTHFSARAKAGFTLAELDEVLRTLHRRGVKGYVTFNTLVFDSELMEAARGLEAIARAGADAIIVQDAGAARLAREVAPGLELHGSTQMSITDAAGVRFAQELGIRRVVLARELSLKEVTAIRRETGCELEIFVHGALCVSYSGQCFSSEAWGGRSANRGQCAQACRLPYEMLVDGETRDLGDARYLLSPGDLYTLEMIPEIIASGVNAIKIEGRYKDAEYVALATSAYRRAVDEACDPAQQRLLLEQVYSRGMGPYFLSGTDHQAVVRGRAPRHRGVPMGRVLRVAPDHVVLEPESVHESAPLKPGDGVVFDAADWRSPQEAEEGGRLWSVSAGKNNSVEIRFAARAVDFRRVRPGDLLWRTDDPNVAKAARRFTEPAAPVRRQPVRVELKARVGEPLKARWSVGDCSTVVESNHTVERAAARGVDPERARVQLARLGNTAYELAALDLDADVDAFVPDSVLNALRREAVGKLEQLQESAPAVTTREPADALGRLMPGGCAAEVGAAQIHLLVRTSEQLDAAISAAPASITLDYLDLYGLRPSVDRVRQAGIAVRVAAPRVLKPGEERVADFLVSLGCPILVRSAGLLHGLLGKPHPELTGDFSLNAANAITARMLLDKGLARITPTYDCNAKQVAELAASAGAHRIEAVVYQHLPVFHTEHCVFCRFLSSGTSYLDCGKPCEQHRVELVDEQGRAHPVLADVGCRNTVFGAEAQEASRHLPLWRDAGIYHFRIEFAHETARQVERIAGAFHGYLGGEKVDLAFALRALSPLGTAEGSLFVPKQEPVFRIL